MIGLVSLVLAVGIMIGVVVYDVLTNPNIRLSEIELINLNVSPTEVEPGETVIVTVEVRNVGKEKGTLELVLLINEVPEQFKLVTLDVGETTSTSFFVEKDIEGSYTVRFFGRVAETFVVVKPEPSP